MKTIKEMLMKKREDLVLEISRRSKASTESAVQDIGDILDSVSEERTRELDLILTDREKRKLAQIDDAIDRIEEGTYGLCDAGRLRNRRGSVGPRGSRPRSDGRSRTAATDERQSP